MPFGPGVSRRRRRRTLNGGRLRVILSSRTLFTSFRWLFLTSRRVVTSLRRLITSFRTLFTWLRRVILSLRRLFLPSSRVIFRQGPVAQDRKNRVRRDKITLRRGEITLRRDKIRVRKDKNRVRQGNGSQTRWVAGGRRHPAILPWQMSGEQDRDDSPAWASDGDPRLRAGGFFLAPTGGEVRFGLDEDFQDGPTRLGGDVCKLR
jgi:hypothetical protein